MQGLSRYATCSFGALFEDPVSRGRNRLNNSIIIIILSPCFSTGCCCYGRRSSAARLIQQEVYKVLFGLHQIGAIVEGQAKANMCLMTCLRLRMAAPFRSGPVWGEICGPQITVFMQSRLISRSTARFDSSLSDIQGAVLGLCCIFCCYRIVALLFICMHH